MSAGGALAHRFAVRRVMAIGAIAFGAALFVLLDAWTGVAVAGGLIVAGAAPWASRLGAATGLATAGLAYGGGARSEGAATPAAALARGLSFTPALIGLGIVIGLSVAAETAASLWSTLLLRAEAPRLAAIAGLGAAFFAICHQATLRFNADFIRLRFSDQRIIVGSFALAAGGFAVVAAKGGFVASVAGFALIGVGTGAIVPCSFALAALRTGIQPAVGLSSASLFSALTRLPAPLAIGAIAQSFSLPLAIAAFAVALATASGSMAAFAPSGGRARAAG